MTTSTAAGGGARSLSALQALKYPGARPYVVVALLDRTSDLVWWVLLGWLAGSGANAALVLGLSGAIGAAMMFPGGAAIDTRGAVEILRWTAALRAAGFVAWGVVALWHGPSSPLLLTLALAVPLAVVDGYHLPAGDSVLLTLLPREAQQANAAMSRLTTRAAQTSAGVIAGAFLAARLPGAVALVAGLLCALMLVLLRHVPSRRTPAMNAPEEAPAKHIFAGLRFVAADRLLRHSIPAQGSYNLLSGGLTLIGFPLLVRARDWSPGTTGLLFALWGTGLVTGTVVTLVWHGRPQRGRAGLAMILITGTGLLFAVLAQTNNVFFVSALALVAGVVSGPIGVLLLGLTLRQAHGQPEQGGIVAVSTFALSGLEPLGYVVTGLLFEVSSPRTGFLVLGAVIALLGVVGATSRRLWDS